VAALTGWVEPPRYMKGLDPLGVQQPCIAAYSSLLPGITNVTDRVAYYGFGPWLTWTFAQRNPRSTVSEFIEILRRAEVLLTLIGVRHAVTTSDDHFEEHGGTLIGVNTLRKIAEEAKANDVIRLSNYTIQKDSPKRYFKNRRGGLGQYYLGVLRDEYKLLDTTGRAINFTIERGQPMAQQVAAGVNGDYFFRCIEKGEIKLRDLDELCSFCPCQLRTARRATERELLLDTVLGRRAELSENPAPRRQSLALLIDFLRAGAGCKITSEPMDEFLIGCYSAVLPSGKKWSSARLLGPTKALWAFYVRAELYSLAMQRLFREALSAIEVESPEVHSIELSGRWCAESKDFTAAIRRLSAKTYADLLTQIRKSIPPLDTIGNERHEISLLKDVREPESASRGIEAAAKMIVTLLVRSPDGPKSVEEAIGPDGIRLQYYPININTITKRSQDQWEKMTVSAWMADAITWVLLTHRQVAFRKLSQSGDDTRRFRLGDRGFYFEGDMIDVARTLPRLRPAFRFLRDLGLVERADDSRLPIPTKAGLEFLEQVANAA
jgi:hypothetical protein